MQNIDLYEKLRRAEPIKIEIRGKQKNAINDATYAFLEAFKQEQDAFGDGCTMSIGEFESDKFEELYFTIKDVRGTVTRKLPEFDDNINEWKEIELTATEADVILNGMAELEFNDKKESHHRRVEKKLMNL